MPAGPFRQRPRSRARAPSQIAAFLSHSNARVASLVGSSSSAVGGGGGGAGDAAVEQQREKAKRAYEQLKAFHEKKGWHGR